MSKKRLALLAIIPTAIILALIIAIPRRQPNPTPSPVPAPILEPTLFGQISQPLTSSFTGQAPTIPSTLPLYQITSPLSVQNYASALARQLNLSSHPSFPNLWLSPDQLKSLTLNQASGTLTYTFTPTTSAANQLDPATFLPTAKNFLTNTLGVTNIIIDETGIEYLNAQSQPGPVSPSQAQYIKIHFHYNQDTIPLILSTQPSFNQYLLIDRNNVVVKAVFTPPILPQPSSQIVSTITTNEAYENIQQGQGTIVSLDAPQYSHVLAKDLQSVNLNSAVLEYRLDPTTNLIYPYYNFTGTTSSKKTADVKISIIIPAFK